MQAWIAVLAGIAGSIGIALGAIQAHRVPDPALATAAGYLVMHAAAALGTSAWGGSEGRSRLWLWGGMLLLAGSGLFAADMSSRAFLGSKLFPFAAPMGGSTMIAGWLTVAVAGFASRRR